MASDIYARIDRKELVTLNDIARMAFKKYYSPISIITKYLVIQSINNHVWPFDEMGNIIIEHFEDKVQELFEIADNEPQVLNNDVNIKQFKASISWCRRFLYRHGLSMRTPHNERRGQINKKYVKKYLRELANALAEYGPELIVNMDETFVHTFNYKCKVVGIRNKETCEVIRGEKYNEKEGTTVIAATRMNPIDKIPLALVAKGRSKRCEKNTELTNNMRKKKRKKKKQIMMKMKK